MPPIDEGYPRARTVTGMDTAQFQPGHHSNFGRNQQKHTDWANSKTGAKMEPPEYASNNWDD